MRKKKFVAVVTLIGAGYWLWQKRRLLEQARAQLNETGRVQLDTMVALALCAVSAATLLPDVQRALKQLDG